MVTPITEAANPITRNIDVATPSEIVSLLHQCDNEIFNGWEDYQGLFHSATLTTINQVTEVVLSILQAPETGTVIISGCGTSGRLAFAVARNCNRRLRDAGKIPCFQYLIAGCDKALFTSQEAPEDDPACGIEMLRKACEGKKKVLYIGITCGLSAPFVAGQLHYCMQNLDFITPVLLGFNPVNLSRNIEIEHWNRTFLQVAEQLQQMSKKGKGFILNPVIGPEPITGSSRMKSGSTTKILLEAIFSAALTMQSNPSHSWDTNAYLSSYRLISEQVYRYRESVAGLVQQAGASLNSGGSVYYIGWDGLGVMALIDASECPPTYGSSLDDIRGFLDGGYDLLSNNEGDIGYMGKHFKICLKTFESDILPNLVESDLVILCHSKGSFNISSDLWKSRCKRGIITFDTEFRTNSSHHFDNIVKVDLPTEAITELIGSDIWFSWRALYEEIALKWICNAITTGAHIQKGKVFQNFMVDLKVSNNKLFHRSVGIIQRFTALSVEEARLQLLRSIYLNDDLTSEQMNSSTSKHIEKATAMQKVVPCALLSAISKCSTRATLQHLDKQPVIRTAISESMKS